MIELGPDEDIHTLIHQNSLVILQFGSETCMPCHAIHQRIDCWQKKYPDVLTRYVSIEEYPERTAQLAVFSVPAVLVYAEGHEALRETGYFSLDEILEKTERYIQLMNR